ncbi:MAG TPA: hypothetical protein VG722_03500 [Tepidisphaeraceae bacterium]|nr:hypothetical protein [Tepidisphaeraceae bacterium]
MNALAQIASELPRLTNAMSLATQWLLDKSQVQTQRLGENDGNSKGHPYTNWRGAFRGEYSAAKREWNFVCPIWHGGQAIKTLVAAYEVAGGPHLLNAARLGADFLLRNQLTDGPDSGLLLAYENRPDAVNSSAVLESLDGLLMLSRITTHTIYRDAAVRAARWLRDRAWRRGEGLVLDMYLIENRTFLDRSFDLEANSRPLADDAIWLKMYQLTGETAFRDLFYEVLQRLLRDERPPGNWIDYEPCSPDQGWIHPRQAYWWGWPMIAAWRHSHEQRWLSAAIRSGERYLHAQRKDGGLFRHTYLDFNTRSFSHATSGTLCAAILWMNLFQETHETRWLEPIFRSMKYALSLQFTAPSDSNLLGCILERLVPPDGTDRSPYHIRDLGTIFFIQAAAKLLKESQ